MPTNIRPWHCPAELRAERHARTFLPRQIPPADPRVLRLKADGWLAPQIAMILKIPVSEVRLQLATQTITTTHARKT
jgi:hypothetical protein